MIGKQYWTQPDLNMEYKHSEEISHGVIFSTALTLLLAYYPNNNNNVDDDDSFWIRWWSINGQVLG